MCGIAGWVSWQGNLNNADGMMAQMISSLKHRGPDDQGIWAGTYAVLGHRRLVVVDPLGGKQPMECRNGYKKCVITYNGELYNTRDLRCQLLSKGYSFKTQYSDTETLLLSYLEWGRDCVKRLNGIYAFAIWDEAEQALFMARDRLGVKPLFYAAKGGQLLFASEIKALMRHPLISSVVKAEGLAEILVMGPGRTPGHGIFSDILELKSGHTLWFDRNGVKVSRYWQLHNHQHLDDMETTAMNVRELLHDAVSRQMVADVPLCSLLSGGLDSSLISALAVQTLGGIADLNLNTYCVQYDQAPMTNKFTVPSDTEWAKEVADYLGTVHHVVEIKPQELFYALFPALLATDIPGMADVDTSMMLLCQEIRRKFTVALSGECADEVFGGYPWFHDVQTGIDRFPWMSDPKERLTMLDPEIVAVIRPEEYLADRVSEALQEMPLEPWDSTDDIRRKQISYLTMTRFMPTLLSRKDRMSMASGLEIRVPFSDHRLVEYAWNIPWNMKMAGGEVKGILRLAGQGLLPQEAIYRPKSPYPKSKHPQFAALVCARMRSLLQDPSSPLLDLIQKEHIIGLLDSTEPYFKRPWYGQLMGDIQWLAYLIQTDLWLRHYQVEMLL